MGTIAIIPARGGSKGLKNKNILELNQKPLIAYTIQAAISSRLFEKVIVSTDSKDIAKVSVEYGAEVPFLRPAELASDTARSIDVIIHAVDWLNQEGVEVNHVVLLQPTSPLRTGKHIAEAMDLYLEHGNPLVSVCEANTHPELTKIMNGEFLEDYVKEKTNATRRQDLPKIYELNGAIYISPRKLIKEEQTLYKDKVIPYVMDKLSSVDIDDHLDFLFAETLITNGVVKDVK